MATTDSKNAVIEAFDEACDAEFKKIMAMSDEEVMAGENPQAVKDRGLALLAKAEIEASHRLLEEKNEAKLH